MELENSVDCVKEKTFYLTYRLNSLPNQLPAGKQVSRHNLLRCLRHLNDAIPPLTPQAHGHLIRLKTFSPISKLHIILTVSALFKTSNQVQAQGNFSTVSSALGVARAGHSHWYRRYLSIPKRNNANTISQDGTEARLKPSRANTTP